MSAHSYNLRTRLNTSSTSSRTPSNSPLIRTGSRSPRKQPSLGSGLQLKHVIGTTTTTPGGLSSCEATNSFAYCAGSVAVLANILADNSITYRYFKAHPTAVALSSTSLYSDTLSTPNTPTRRSSTLPTRRALDSSQTTSYTREWLDDANGQTWSARERIKAATCVSLSPDGRLLAVGETGYQPRVLLFSTSPNTSVDTPLSIIAEHSVGVRSVAFSPDSRHLATLGDINDGFLYIWQVNSKTGETRLQSTNKCTTNICDMTWCGNNVVTVGTRHIKIWHVSTPPKTSPQKKARLRMDGEQVPSPGPTPLPGRNCLLGKMVDSTFTSIAAMSSSRAILCTDDGYLCELDLSGGNAVLSPIRPISTSVTAIAYWQNAQKALWVVDDKLHQDSLNLPNDGDLRNVRSNLLPGTGQEQPPRRSLLRESLGLAAPKIANTLAIACISRHTICIDAGGYVRLIQLGDQVLELDSRKLSSHGEAVRGVKRLPKASSLGSFFTWAKNGELRFWDAAGDLLCVRNVVLEQVSDADELGSNELSVVCFVDARGQFVVGDKFGLLQAISQDRWQMSHVFRAHSAEITDITCHQNSSLLATCSRDRTVQIFEWRRQDLELLQTSDDHISAVHSVAFNEDGSRLLSCSADRTIVVRDRVMRESNGQVMKAFLSNRIITLRGSPLSMSLLPGNQDILFVSTMDRLITKIDVSNGSSLDTFKVTDKETDDTTTLSSICLSSMQFGHEPSILAGCSPIDKSIRVYDAQRGTLMSREWGHTEGVSDMILLESEDDTSEPPQKTIISTGSDNTIMIWSVLAPPQIALTPLQELSQSQAELFYDSDATPYKSNLVSLPPLRKILSKPDAAEFSRQNSPTRETSPHRLRKKTSRLALATSIDEVDETLSPQVSGAQTTRAKPLAQDRSPSPPSTSMMRPKKQRSRSEFIKANENKRTECVERSPPSMSVPISTSGTSSHSGANKGRLRRPPSVPADLRLQASIQTPPRRQSMSITTDFGSIGMASEATCRMLKTYRKKLQSSKDDISLDHLEKELESVLKIIKQRKRTMTETKHDVDGAGPSTRSKPGDDDDELNGMTAMLAETHMN